MLKLKTHLTKYSNSQVQSKKHNNQRTKNTKKTKVNLFSAEEKNITKVTDLPDYCKKTKAFTSASQANWVLGNEETQRECESV